MWGGDEHWEVDYPQLKRPMALDISMPPKAELVVGLTSETLAAPNHRATVPPYGQGLCVIPLEADKIRNRKQCQTLGLDRGHPTHDEKSIIGAPRHGEDEMLKTDHDRTPAHPADEEKSAPGVAHPGGEEMTTTDPGRVAVASNGRKRGGTMIRATVRTRGG